MQRDGDRADQRAAPRLRRLRGHAARLGGPPAREDARRCCAAPRFRLRDSSSRRARCRPRRTRSRQLEPPPDEIVVSTHSAQRSSWLRRDVVQRDHAGRRRVARCTHVVASDEAAVAERNVLVLANETVISKELLDRIRARAAERARELPDRRASGQRASRAPRPSAGSGGRSRSSARKGSTRTGRSFIPDPFTATIEALHDERVDEIIVSTFPSARSGWLRRDLVERLRGETGLTVDHVVSEGAE